jgi:hypothetical protein
MVALRHPMSGTLYSQREGRQVVVGEGSDHGLFTAEGRWISGTRRTADAEMCRWLADGKAKTIRRGLTAPTDSDAVEGQ